MFFYKSKIVRSSPFSNNNLFFDLSVNPCLALVISRGWKKGDNIHNLNPERKDELLSSALNVFDDELSVVHRLWQLSREIHPWLRSLHNYPPAQLSQISYSSLILQESGTAFPPLISLCQKLVAALISLCQKLVAALISLCQKPVAALISLCQKLVAALISLCQKLVAARAPHVRGNGRRSFHFWQSDRSLVWRSFHFWQSDRSLVWRSRWTQVARREITFKKKKKRKRKITIRKRLL
jgi:hypothetical protein